MSADDDLNLLSDVLHWLNASQVQVQRFLVAFDQLERQPRIRADGWRRGMYSAEAHFLVLALNHVITALDRLPDTIRPQLTPDVRDPTEILRDVLEHWDEQRPAFSDSEIKKERSGKKFAERYPDASPWSFSFSNDAAHGTRIAGVLQVELVVDALDQLETVLVPLRVKALEEIGLLPYRGPAVDFSPLLVGVDSPEDLALGAFDGRAQLVRSITDGHHAAVLVLADTEPETDVDGAPWWVTAERTPEGWVCTGGSSGSSGGWTRTDESTGRGTGYVGGPALPPATRVKVSHRGRIEEVPVHRGYFAWAAFDVTAEESPEVMLEVARGAADV